MEMEMEIIPGREQGEGANQTVTGKIKVVKSLMNKLFLCDSNSNQVTGDQIRFCKEKEK